MTEEIKVTKESLEYVLGKVSSRANEDLFAKSREELESYWHFTWGEEQPLLGNTYKFFKMLELYRGFCRRWEEHHNGTCCVVERVRDRYLVPKLKQFIEDFTAAVE